MEKVTIRTLKLLGGHAALDFANTVNSRGARFGPDVLDSFGDLVTWSERLGVVDETEATGLRWPPAERGEAALVRAKLLREAIYRIFAARPSADSADLALLQCEVNDAQAARILKADSDGYAWRWRAIDPDSITHRVALAAADLLTSRALGRVHVCPGENCGWLFLDNSRSGRRLWCSEETCGTRSRVRRWRDRRRKV